MGCKALLILRMPANLSSIAEWLAAVVVQGCSLSDMTSELQSMDPLHTAYLDWRLFMRNLIAGCVPSLPVLSADQLLQLDHRMRQADGNADGLLTQPELLSVNMQPLFVAAASETEVGTTTSSSADGGHAAALKGNQAADGQQKDEDAKEAAPCSSDEVAGEDALSDESVAPLKHLLWLMFAKNSAAIDIEEVMLYFCCDIDGAEGLQKAFAVLTGNQVDGQVRIMSTT